MRKFLISKDTKDSKDSKDTKDTKDSKVINKKATNKDPDTSQNIQFPLKRVLHETTNSSTLIQKDIKPLNKFKIQKEKNNIQENLTKIQKLSYLMRETEYFNLPTTATPAEEEDIDIRTSSRARREENIEIVTENENRNNEVNDDGKMIEIIAISDTEEFVSDENILEDQDEDCQSKCAIQTTIDEFYQIDQIKLEDRIYQSLPLESKPLASPYFAKVPSQFYQDPAQYCKPFQLYRSNVSSVLLKNLTTQPYISSIESNLINFRLTPRSGGITCLEFDPVGVLLAVGSANGLLRVYDSDEILFRTQKQSDIDQRSITTQPVYTLATSKSISSIVWIPSPPYESIAIGFLYHSTIDIVDCNTNELVGQLTTKTLSRRGYSYLHILQSPSNSSWFFIIAGSPIGLLYMWKYPAINNELYTSQPIWEAIGSPSSQPNDHIGIVGIFTPLNSEKTTIVVTITRSGILCIWDVMKHSLLSFSSCRTPTLLTSYSLWERNQSSIGLIHSVSTDPNYPLSITMKISSGNTLYPLTGKLYLNFSTGERFQYDCCTFILTPISCNSRIIRPSSNQSIIIQDTLEPWNIGSIVPSQSPLVAHGCDVKGGDFLPYQINCIPSIFDPQIDMITPSQRNILSPFYDRSNSSRTHYSSLSMVRSSVLTHTLTGYIYEASPQSHTIMTTHDLSAFLCSIMESTRHSSNAKQDKTNSDGVHHGISPSISIYEESSRSSQPNKSCLISFTSFPQSSQTRDTDFPPENYYCILRINGCKITLERPYEGPSVVKGVPKVVMRTNLLPSSAAASKKDATGNISSIALTTHPTIVRVHPQLPYLFVGHIDDSLCIITPESYCN